MVEYIVSILVVLMIIAGVWAIWWGAGGMHLDYVKSQAPIRLQDYDFEDCVYDGYDRSITGGFGGKIWYLCQKSGIYYSIYFARRFNSPELQMYGPFQKTTFPAEFQINN